MTVHDGTIEEMKDAASRCVFCVPMRDGTQLALDVYGPLEQRRPVVLERTPYGRRRTDQSERYAGMEETLPRHRIAERFVEAGFSYAVQDCRGCGDSGGRFSKYLQEPKDGADTIGWLRRQAWCDGFVAMTGFSYAAACQMSVVGFEDEEPDAVTPDCGGFSDAYRSGVRQGGALAMKQATWAHAQAIRDLVASGDILAADELQAQDLQHWLLDSPWIAGHSPLESAVEHRDNLAAFWQAGEDSDFWRAPGLWTDKTKLAQSRTPSFFVTSWFDTSSVSVIENFQAMLVAPKRLVIGPWDHGARFTSVGGGVHFGRNSVPEDGLGGSMIDLRLDWLKAVHDGQALPLGVTYFEMGGGDGGLDANGCIRHGGRWRKAVSWPPDDCRAMTLQLSEGRLLADRVTAEPSRWISDPGRPVPTLGGAINSGEPVMSGGMWDQNAVFAIVEDEGGIRCQRDDVLVFMSAPLEEDVAIAGAPFVDVHVSADRPDVDITMKLIDCYPDGPALNLSDGILRLRYRQGFDAAVMMTPGEIVSARVVGSPCANLFRRGHRIRVDIAASNFPNFDINPQTGGPQGIPQQRQVAEIKLHSTADEPSLLTLPVRSVQ